MNRIQAILDDHNDTVMGKQDRIRAEIGYMPYLGHALVWLGIGAFLAIVGILLWASGQ